MDHLSRIDIFIHVVKQQSFAGAARALGITSSAVSKQIKNLEDELQVKLLNRTTRNVSVTEEGAIYFERAARAMEDLREAKEQLNELKACPRGPLKVSLPLSFGMSYLAKSIACFAHQYPDVELDISMDDRFVNITEEGFDAVVRIGSLEDSSLIARKLASCPITICASPEYLSKHGEPQTPEDLINHNILIHTRNNVMTNWQYRSCNEPDIVKSVTLKTRFKCDTGELMLHAAMQDVGIVFLPIFYTVDPLKDGRLVQILDQYQYAEERNIYAVFPANRYLSTRLRLLIDQLTQTCAQLPWEQK